MSEEAKAQSGSKSAPQPTRKKRVLLLTIVLVVGIGGSAAGSLYGQQLLAGGKPASSAEAHGEAPAEGAAEHGEKGKKESGKGEKGDKEEEGAGGEVISLDAIIVDLRGSDGDLHHLKVGLAVELAKQLPEEEVKRLTPRARDAAITYLRSLTMDDVTSMAKFEDIRHDIFEKVSQGMGKSRVRAVMFTDFVAQ